MRNNTHFFWTKFTIVSVLLLSLISCNKTSDTSSIEIKIKQLEGDLYDATSNISFLEDEYNELYDEITNLKETNANYVIKLNKRLIRIEGQVDEIEENISNLFDTSYENDMNLQSNINQLRGEFNDVKRLVILMNN